MIDEKTLSFDNATPRTSLEDFLKVVVSDASEGTSFRECKGATFDSHEIHYRNGEVIYMSSRGDVISFEEFQRLVYISIVTKNQKTCIRPFQLNVRFRSGRVGVASYIRRWHGFVYAESEPKTRAAQAAKSDHTVTLRLVSENQSQAWSHMHYHVIPMGVQTRNKKSNSLICADVAHGIKCRLGTQCPFIHSKKDVAVKALRKKWAEKEKGERKRRKKEEKKRQKEERKKKEEAARKKKQEEAARRKKEQEEAQARRKKQQEEARRKKKQESEDEENSDDDSLPDLVCEDDSDTDSDDSSIPSLVDESNSSEEEEHEESFDSNEEDEDEDDDDDVYFDKSTHVSEKEMESALNVKAIGNKKFAAKNFKEALKMYESGLAKLEHVSPKCTASDAVELVHVLFLNCAAVHIEMKHYREAVSCASKSLAYWPRVKAYYRRGTALLRMERYEHAIKDFKSALKLRPNDSTVKKSLKEAQEKLKA